MLFYLKNGLAFLNTYQKEKKTILDEVLAAYENPTKSKEIG